jgi:hypothetical protein
MKIEMTNIPTFNDVLLCYSGRRLQFAIKLGILPTPERLSQVLNRKVKARKPILASKMMSLSKAQYVS